MVSTCTACNRGTLRLRKSDRLRRWFKTVGVLLLLPAVLGVWLAWSWHDASRGAYPTLTEESAFQLRGKLEGLDVPEHIIKIVSAPKFDNFDREVLKGLSPKQYAAIRDRMSYYRPEGFGRWETSHLEEGLAPIVLILAIFLGLIGFLFLRTKRVLLCSGCGAVTKAPPRSQAIDGNAQAGEDCCRTCGQGRMRLVSSYRYPRALGLVGIALLGLGVLGILLGATVVLALTLDAWDFYSRFHVSGIGAVGIYFGCTILLVVGAVISDKRSILQCTVCGHEAPVD